MKSEVRKQICSAIASMGPEAQLRASQCVCRNILAQDEYRRAKIVMAFMPIAGEPDIIPIIQAGLDSGKTVLVPRVDRRRHLMDAVEIHRLTDADARGSFGIREPSSGGPFAVGQIDLIIVPGLGFDRAGRRLGRGGGFYDRFLSIAGLKAVRCGAAFGCQVLDDIPHDQHDQTIHMLVTDKSILRFAGRATD
ncbi:MAG: 5-formyltetrahydrofolate cyclo-ligase [Planctomycetes bacterium]|nr:5-formyltetrahydrofolate cyclo-ligase [Planctomycetota bacterium]